MKKDSQVFLKHILDSIEWIEKDTAGLSKEKFFENVPMQDGNTDVFYYEVQLSKDPTFNIDPATATAAVQWNLVHGGQSNPLDSYKTAPLEAGATYYWRVRPRVQGDRSSAEWSTIVSFKTSVDARILSESELEVISKIEQTDWDKQANKVVSMKEHLARQAKIKAQEQASDISRYLHWQGVQADIRKLSEVSPLQAS